MGIYESFRLPDHCSVYQVEVNSIQAAMMHMDKMKPNMRALDSCVDNSKTIMECRRSLNEMAKHYKITLIWVPADQNIYANCIAELARKATTIEILQEKNTIGMPLATCRLCIKQFTLRYM